MANINKNRIFGAKPRQQQDDYYGIPNTSTGSKTTTTKKIMSEQDEKQQNQQYNQHKSRPITKTAHNPNGIGFQRFENGSQTFLGQIERERSKSKGCSRSRGRSRSLGDANGRGHRSRSKGRREKFLPPKKDDTELFDENQLIKEGNFANVFENDIAVLNQNGNHPKILKPQNFTDCGFSQEIQHNLELKQYNNPSPVQKAVIPIIQKTQNDLIVHAPTGCGKTASFLLPITNELQGIIKNRARNVTNGNRPYVIIVSPTKELAEQLANDARAFSIQTGVTVAHTYGDIPMKPTLIDLAKGCDIFVATCGRLQHFVEEGHIQLDQLRYLILDEADRLLKLNDFNNCIKLIKLHADINPEHRVLMFSATYEPELFDLGQQFLRDDNFILVQVAQSHGLNSAAVTLSQTFLKVRRHVGNDKDEMNKEETLRDFLINHKNTQFTHDPSLDDDYFKVPKTIVFVEKRREANRLTTAIRESNIRAHGVNSDFTLKMRWDAVNKFASNEVDVLVSTDVLARGMNFPNLQYVINFDLPSRDSRGTQDEYIHRIGRTGRMGNYGDAISYFDPDNDDDVRNSPYYVKVLIDSGEEVPDWLREIADREQKQKTMQMNGDGKLAMGGAISGDNHPDDPYFLGVNTPRDDKVLQQNTLAAYKPSEKLENTAVDKGW